MRKRIYDTLVILVLLTTLTCLGYKGNKIYPKNLEVAYSPNMSLTEVHEKITIEKNVTNVVEVSEEDEIDEEFCDQLEILALCIEAEAGNQDLMGKRLVCDVILNRVESERFPDTIEGVITQKYHFSTYWNGAMQKVKEPSEDTFEAIRLELHERTDSQILFFTAHDYSRYCVPAYRHGAHYFGY